MMFTILITQILQLLRRRTKRRSRRVKSARMTEVSNHKYTSLTALAIATVGLIANIVVSEDSLPSLWDHVESNKSYNVMYQLHTKNSLEVCTQVIGKSLIDDLYPNQIVFYNRKLQLKNGPILIESYSD